MKAPPPLPKRLAQGLLLVAALTITHSAAAISATPAELEEAHRWAAARFSSDPPFSFRYGGRPSSELFKTWTWTRSKRSSVPHQTEYSLLSEDPATGLKIGCVAVEYDDFPVAEWTLYFTNSAATDSLLLEDIQALDAAVASGGADDFVLYHHAGDDCSPHSYAPQATPLGPGGDLRFAPNGGRPTTGAFPYFNLARPGGGVIAAVGWPGQWAARFTRETSGPVRLRAGQELTHFRLHAGESARSPLIALLFWQGDRIRAQNLWRRWMLTHNLPRTRDGQVPPPILSACSGGFFPGLKCNEKEERLFIESYVRERIPLNYWWMAAVSHEFLKNSFPPRVYRGASIFAL